MESGNRLRGGYIRTLSRANRESGNRILAALGKKRLLDLWLHPQEPSSWLLMGEELPHT